MHIRGNVVSRKWVTDYTSAIIQNSGLDPIINRIFTFNQFFTFNNLTSRIFSSEKGHYCIIKNLSLMREILNDV